MGLALDARRGRLYVSTGHGGTVAVVDLGEPPKVLAEITVGARPWGIALASRGTRLYSANGPSADVSIVDTERLTVVGTVAVGHGPWGVVAR